MAIFARNAAIERHTRDDFVVATRQTPLALPQAREYGARPSPSGADFFGLTNSMRSNFDIANSLTLRLHGGGESACMPTNRLDSKATID